jgi:hypothetical protein
MSDVGCEQTAPSPHTADIAHPTFDIEESPVQALDLTNPEVVRGVFAAGAKANHEASCREGSIDRISAPGRLIATGDLHDNPLHFARLVRVAGMEEGVEVSRCQGVEGGARPGALDTSTPRRLDPCHLLLHEIIHSDRLINGMDFSFRALARVAALKARFPEHVHVLLANHELAQLKGAGIIKDGVRVVEAFNEGVDYVFGDDAELVQEGIREFITSMPLALRAHCEMPEPDGRGVDILCAHSLPGTAMMGRFDASVLSRDLTDEDYEPRQGAAHIMVWGRGYDAEQLEDLVERWGVNWFILGHEKAETGVTFVPPCAVVLNSDHERGVYLPIDLSNPPRPEEAAWLVQPLAQVEYREP